MKRPGLLLLLLLGGCDLELMEEDLPRSERCADCHEPFVRQWQRSRHFQAWEDDKYVVATASRSRPECWPCHIPVAVRPGLRPQARDRHREEGVSCLGCHFKGSEAAMVGPFAPSLGPHPAQEDPLMGRSEFCGGCHTETLKEWRTTGSRKHCQDCHMPHRGDGPIAFKATRPVPHRPKARHDHSFPALLAQKDDVHVRMVPGSLEIINRGVPHNLPTAEHGSPRLHLLVRIPLPDGEVLRIRRSLSPAQHSALLPHIPYRVPLPQGVALEGMELRLFRVSGTTDERQPIGRWVDLARGASLSP